MESLLEILIKRRSRLLHKLRRPLFEKLQISTQREFFSLIMENIMNQLDKHDLRLFLCVGSKQIERKEIFWSNKKKSPWSISR